MIFSVLLRRCKKTLFQMYEYAWITLFILIALLYAFGYFTMYYFGEIEILENYTWWFSVTITTVGYGDYPVKDSQLTLNPDLLFIVKSGMALFYTAPERLLDIDLSGIGVWP